MQSLPISVQVGEIVPQLSIVDVYSYCQSGRGVYDVSRQCNNGSFWRRIGKNRCPSVAPIISTGKPFAEVGRVLYLLNQYLEARSIISIEARNVWATGDSQIDEIVGFKPGDGVIEVGRIQMSICQLHNLKYLVRVVFDDLNDRYILSADQVAEYLLAITTMTSSIQPETSDSTIVQACRDLVDAMAPTRDVVDRRHPYRFMRQGTFGDDGDRDYPNYDDYSDGYSSNESAHFTRLDRNDDDAIGYNDVQADPNTNNNDDYEY